MSFWREASENISGSVNAAMAAFTGQTNYQISDVAKAAVRYVTGDFRPYPRVSEEDLPQTRVFKSVLLSTKSIPESTERKMECILKLSETSLTFEFETRAEPLVIDYALLSPGKGIQVPMKSGDYPFSMRICLRDFRVCDLNFAEAYLKDLFMILVHQSHICSIADLPALREDKPPEAQQPLKYFGHCHRSCSYCYGNVSLFILCSTGHQHLFSVSPMHTQSVNDLIVLFVRHLGWGNYDLAALYSAMFDLSKWRQTNINEDYALCPTYPKHIFVPVDANDALLFEAAKFRSQGRIPVLTYEHHNSATISRCAQPLSGIMSRRCGQDEMLFRYIYGTNNKYPNCQTHIVDARPKINAQANRIAGKGVESQTNYDAIVTFLDVGNIHVMRSSLQVLLTAAHPTSNLAQESEAVAKSNWLDHVRAVLSGTEFIARRVEQNESVVVHCSDGWDRTPQLCALAQILLHSHFRTIEGFQALIYKDWLSFGHKFEHRFGFVEDSKEVSPIFTQFLDCVWQLQRMHPKRFEFNEKYLVTLHDLIVSCTCGTFLCNNEKEREKHMLKQRTPSVWECIDSAVHSKNRQRFLNPYFKPLQDKAMLPVNIQSNDMKVFTALYFPKEEEILSV